MKEQLIIRDVLFYYIRSVFFLEGVLVVIYGCVRIIYILFQLLEEFLGIIIQFKCEQIRILSFGRWAGSQDWLDVLGFSLQYQFSVQMLFCLLLLVLRCQGGNGVLEVNFCVQDYGLVKIKLNRRRFECSCVDFCFIIRLELVIRVGLRCVRKKVKE